MSSCNIKSNHDQPDKGTTTGPSLPKFLYSVANLSASILDKEFYSSVQGEARILDTNLILLWGLRLLAGKFCLAVQNFEPFTQWATRQCW